MKVSITGRIIATDHTRQSFTIKPDNATPIRVYAGEQLFAKLASRVEKDRIEAKGETLAEFVVSGKVLLRFGFPRVVNITTPPENRAITRSRFGAFVKQLKCDEKFAPKLISSGGSKTSASTNQVLSNEEE